MKRTMNAAVLPEFGKPLSVDEVTIPEPRYGEIPLKVASCDVCHTDPHAANGDWPVKPALPLIPGYEAVGHVAALGSGVATLREGDHVGVASLHDACGSCEYCVTGWETLCHKQHNSGYSVNGGFAEYVIGAAPYVAHLPAAADSVVMAPILCAGVTTYKSIKETEAKPGAWIAILGVGGLGHLAVQYAKAMGRHVAALDVSEAKLALARSLGADVTIDAGASDAASQVIKDTSGGAHGVLVTAVSPTAFSQALGMVRRKGTVCLVGLPPGELQTPIFDMVLKRVTIRGSIVGMRKDLAEAIAFAAAGKVAATIEKADLSNINDVLSRLETGNIQGRVLLELS